MAPPQSPAWNYFTVRDFGMAECHFCQKFIRVIKNTSPLIAHLRCKHPEVFESTQSGFKETAEATTQTSDKDIEPQPFSHLIKEEPIDSDFRDIKEEQLDEMEIDMNLRLREMMALRLEDTVGDMQFRATTDPWAQLVRALCESCLWLIRDWPNQKIDNLESVRASRLDTLGRLRQLLRARPHKNSEMDGLILLLSDALLTISEQWPGGESDKPAVATPQPAPPQQLHPTATATVTTSVHIPPVYMAPGTACKPPAPKLPRMAAKPWTIDGYQQPSTSSQRDVAPSGPRLWKQPIMREMPQAGNAGAQSALWTFFSRQSADNGTKLAKCSICSKLIARHNCGTSGMKNHLRVNHPVEYATLGMESSASSENSQSSPPGVPTDTPLKLHSGEAEKGQIHTAIIAALNSEKSNLPDMRNSPSFCNDYIKEEEMDFDEVLNSMNDADNFNDEPTTSSQALPPTPVPSLSQMRVQKGGSDIWSFFTKVDGEAGEKHGCCTLCDWSRKIYNHGTNTMWSHLRRVHPHEYYILKPFEHNPLLHGHFNLGSTVSLSALSRTASTQLNQGARRDDSQEKDGESWNE